MILCVLIYIVTYLQVMAIIVIGLGVLIVMPFHVVVREKNTVLKKLKWYLWLLKPDFYLVSRALFSLIIHFVMCPLKSVLGRVCNCVASDFYAVNWWRHPTYMYVSLTIAMQISCFIYTVILQVHLWFQV